MHEQISKILEEYKKVWALRYASNLLGWDIETYMPEDSAKTRGEVLAQLEALEQKFIIDMKPLIEKASKIEDLDDFEKGVVRVLNRRLKFYMSIPSELLMELHKITTESAVIWRESKKRSDFNSFKPYLEKIVELERQIAEKLGYEGSPYNALLDIYEEGLTVNDVDSVFNMLLPSLKSILEKVRSENRFPSSHSLEDMAYDVEVMKKVNEELLRVLDMPVGKKFRMDVSAHPFTQGLSVDDVRITTRYEGIDFKRTMFSVIHESGHAIYELQLDPKLEWTPVGEGVSLGIHESQSRFWENIIGRSRAFVKVVYPIIKKYLNLNYSEEEIYKYFNTVKPSFIRVDADEVTYNFHIAIRYELEKKLIENKMSVSDLPSAWNDLMEKYLGIRPKNDSEGVLQDIHWSQGSFGYFPTYTLGNVVAGMIYHDFNPSKLYSLVEERRISDIKSYLREKIHKYGAIYPPKELLKRSFGESYNAERLVGYLRDKYL
ncbi:MAG: carboxypeptidase M32 [Sulfolobaceae archaeon]|nr:carboxypeptidase M32 [Sulfolobaceae archaeon]